MTLDEEKMIASLFKQGKTYFEIEQLTGIISSTCASTIRRKYPQLSQFRAMQKKERYEKESAQVVEATGLAPFQAEAILQELRAKFDKKKHYTLKKGEEFTVEFNELGFPAVCPVLGIKLDYYGYGKKEASPTFDRKDNTKGYVSGNVFIVSWRANRLKNNGTAAEHYRIADWMAQEGA